jgi:hypothetical protein
VTSPVLCITDRFSAFLTANGLILHLTLHYPKRLYATQKVFLNGTKHVCLSLAQLSHLNIPPLVSLQHFLDAIHAQLFQELPTQPTSTREERTSSRNKWIINSDHECTRKENLCNNFLRRRQDLLNQSAKKLLLFTRNALQF